MPTDANIATVFAELKTGDRVKLSSHASYSRVSREYTVEHAGQGLATLRGGRGGKLVLVQNVHDEKAISAVSHNINEWLSAIEVVSAS